MIERYRPKPQVPPRLAHRKDLVFLVWRPDLFGKVIEPNGNTLKVSWLNGNTTVVPKEWVHPVKIAETST